MDWAGTKVETAGGTCFACLPVRVGLMGGKGREGIPARHFIHPIHCRPAPHTTPSPLRTTPPSPPPFHPPPIAAPRPVHPNPSPRPWDVLGECRRTQSRSFVRGGATEQGPERPANTSAMALHPHSLLDEDQGATPTHENLNVFDDAFEEDDADVVADGFRPPFNHVHRVSGHQDPDDLYDPPSPSRPSPLSQTPQDPSRSSTRKSTTRENPFASPEDEDTADAPLRRTPSGNFAPFTPRATSSASSTHYATAPGPRFGAGGPSHPYAMYPQGTVARAASTASASTARPPPASSTRDGPQHPYALYPQGVSDDLDDELDEEAHNPVPVGFLGVDRPFQRRRGPDGEEQDILGYFGHTEQLPPYTRYPEDGPEKAPLLGIPEPPSALHTRAPVLGSDPGMSLMHTQIQATPQSMTDETQLLRQESGGSRLATSEHSGASTEASAATKKSWSEKSWKERRKTKFCGVPFWAFLLAAGTLSFIAVVLGGVIGGFVEGQEKEEQ